MRPGLLSVQHGGDPVTLRVETRGLDEVRALMGRLGDAAETLAEPIGAEIERQVENRLDSEKSSPSGGRWPGWSPSYRRSGKGRELLERSGALLASIRHVVSGDRIEAGSDLPYARAQNARRPFLGLSTANEAALRALIAAELARIMEAA